ncbi:CLUMA_CG003513, isoform A [Clunio marinus]|uniref:CLUMA_CG003513, isoform A n=1 Tax=Clunio marinus TaxID=568069 RepID=A0A1J1HNL7_9DIPT|nr:CLUMA_CG003513, isoform A [Clunio marinus]
MCIHCEGDLDIRKCRQDELTLTFFNKDESQEAATSHETKPIGLILSFHFLPIIAYCFKLKNLPQFESTGYMTNLKSHCKRFLS